jgi:hypothetical protein
MDECSIEHSKFYTRYCWRKPGQPFKDGCFKPTPREYIKKYVKVWAAISSKGTSKLVFLKSKWSGSTYVNEIINKHVIPSGKKLVGNTFKVYSDNDTSHRPGNRLLETWNVEVIPSPPDFSDL